MRIKKILWASDGSKESRHALKWAELFATRFGASLSALSVIEIPEIGTLKIPADVNTKIALIEHDLVRRERISLRTRQKSLSQKESGWRRGSSGAFRIKRS
jgi:nucleotide-binding universal stress UspA family protein